MSEEILKEIDGFLYQFVQKRFVTVVKMLKFSKKRIEDLLFLLVKAFIRCLYNAKGEIFLRDIVNISRAETLLMLKEPLWSGNFNAIYRLLFNEKMENILSNEMHGWILYLAENNKLPPGSEYHRFMGKYVNK